MAGMGDPELFDTPPERDFDGLTELAAMVTGSPVALLSLVNSERQFFKSATGLPEPWASMRGTPLSHSFCRHVVDSGQALAVQDAPRDPLVRDNLAIRDLSVIAYLGEPVRAPSGTVIGSFCVIDSQPRVWEVRDRRIVETLARCAEQVIALRAANEAQEKTLRKLREANRALEAQSAQLAEAQRRAERALADQTTFVGGLSHELRTPLNGVLGGVALLDLARDAEAQARCRDMIRASAAALNDCVDDLVAFSRIGAGVDRPEMAPFDPAAAVHAAAGAVRALAAEKGLAVVVEAHPGTPAAWVGDRRRIEGVLVNLLGNSVKYTAKGRVGVSVRRQDDVLEFRVWDTGMGVPAAHREAIFEPFNRGDPAAARSAVGTGLGLAIACETARRIGGSLTLERSVVGEGSTFLITAPMAVSRPQATETPRFKAAV